MISSKEYQEYLNKLKKEELLNIVKDFHILCDIYNYDKGIDIGKKKKKDIVDYIIDIKEVYIKYIVMLLDIKDYNLLKELMGKLKEEFLVNNREFINYLIEKKVLFQEDNLEIPVDIKELIKKYINDKEVINNIKRLDIEYKNCLGIITAYGVIARQDFCALSKLDFRIFSFYYKNGVVIDSKKIYSNKLSNKKKINNYCNNTEYRVFNKKEFGELGDNTYHHSIKSYKKLIRMLKNNYVFKKNDIMFIDKVVIIPYLYTSLNEEDIANKELEKTLLKYFEFKGDKLKNRLYEEIKKIRNDFPLWEYRGKTKNEVIH